MEHKTQSNRYQENFISTHTAVVANEFYGAQWPPAQPAPAVSTGSPHIYRNSPIIFSIWIVGDHVRLGIELKRSEQATDRH